MKLRPVIKFNQTCRASLTRIENTNFPSAWWAVPWRPISCLTGLTVGRIGLLSFPSRIFSFVQPRLIYLYRATNPGVFKKRRRKSKTAGQGQSQPAGSFTAGIPSGNSSKHSKNLLTGSASKTFFKRDIISIEKNTFVGLTISNGRAAVWLRFFDEFSNKLATSCIFVCFQANGAKGRVEDA